MEVLTFIVLIGLALYLAPYIIGAFMLAVGLVGGAIALILAGIVKLFR